MNILDFDKINNAPLAEGAILIAEPFLQDSNFGRTVLFICQHDADGTCALVINKKHETTTVKDVVEDLPNCDFPIWIGGPMEHNKIFVLHNVPDLINGQNVANLVSFGADFDKLTECILLGLVDEKNVKFILGYSGWDVNQLEDELKEQAWFVAKPAQALLLSTTAEKIYEESLGLLGKPYKKLASFTPNPQLN
jgi:putative transcriptional regulator